MVFFVPLKKVGDILAKQKHIGAILTLKDNMSATLKGIRKEQSAFKKDVDTTRKALEKSFNKKYNMRLNNTAAMKAIKSTRKALEPFRKKMVVVMAYKDMITSRVRKTHNQLKVLGKKVFSPVVAIKDKTGAFFSKLKNGIFSMKTLIGTAIAGAGIGKVVGSGAELEKQMISMEHFIGINNKNLDASGVKDVSANFLKELRENAQVTPFSDSEVIAAGTRALGVTNGDTKAAMELVKIAEDMAALTPGKTIEMAMEALADAKNGEMERLKEFNAKVSAEEFQTLGFMGVVDKKLKSQFEGGAQKLSKSASGMWATITGGIGAKLQDLGLSVIEKLKPHLESFIAWMDKSGPTIDKWAGYIATGVGWTIDKVASFVSSIKQYIPMAREVVGNVAAWISDKFSWIGEKVSNLNIDWGAAWEGIKSVMGTAWDFIKPVLDFVAEGIKLIWELVEWAFPKIQKVIETVWSIIKPILEGLGDVIGSVAKGIGKLSDWIGGKNKKNVAGGTTTVDGSHASGLTRVPYDGYIAELHKDEAIIPANQNPYINSVNSATRTEKPTIIINVDAKDKTPREVINEIIPPLKLALENM